ncbi:MAG: LytTR family DNA-binding domain-containing protein [Marinilabilia sp.]
MNILIVEDELPTQRLLKDMIEKARPAWNIAGCTAGVEETIEWLNDHPQPDLIFMDIQLSDGTSFEIFDKVKVDSIVIFTTAFDEYAIQAFRVNSIDYLLKPINQNKLEEAIRKYEHLFEENPQQTKPYINYQELAKAMASDTTNYRSRLMVNLPEGFQKINTSNIAWLVSANKITTAVTFDQHHHVIDFTLDRLEKELDPSVFFRANRQYILNIEAIHKVENWFNGKLVVKTRPAAEDKIVISRERARNFKEWINQ